MDVIDLLLNDDDIIYCYICETPMKYINTKKVKQLGKCKVYKCPECGEIIYCPINKYKRKEDENNDKR